jgi:predicted transcriptional regulator
MIISTKDTMTTIRRICPEDISKAEPTSAVRHMAAVLGDRKVKLVESLRHADSDSVFSVARVGDTARGG